MEIAIHKKSGQEVKAYLEVIGGEEWWLVEFTDGQSVYVREPELEFKD
jgi:hypothetical protein